MCKLNISRAIAQVLNIWYPLYLTLVHKLANKFEKYNWRWIEVYSIFVNYSLVLVSQIILFNIDFSDFVF